MKITAKMLAAEEKRLQGVEAAELTLQIEIVRRLRPQIEATAARLVEMIEAYDRPISEDAVRRICQEIASDISADVRWRMLASTAAE